MTLFPDRTEKLYQGVASALAKLPKDRSPKYVHRLRTTIRRVESLVSYAEPGLGRKQKKALEEMAGLRKRAGKVRDLDMQMELLKQIANGSTAGDRRTISTALQQKREKQASRLVAMMRKTGDSKFLSHVQKITGKAAEAERALLLPDPLAEARGRLGKLRSEFAARSSHSPAELHRLRIQIKKLRYLAELADDSPEQREFSEAMQSAQDALGAWHDWQELSRTAETQFRQRMNCPLLVEVRALRAARQATALAAVRQLFARYKKVPADQHSRSIHLTGTMLRRAG